MKLYKSLLQTKIWRKNQPWYKTGKSNECEIYQRFHIESIIKNKCIKTNIRINTNNYDLIELQHPLKQIDGFEYTENFDGLCLIDEKTYYFNLKFVCDKGGAQIRTLKQVYHFIKYQLKHLIKYKNDNIYFINILDGDCSNCYINKFKYLINKDEYKDIVNNVFIGDLYDFKKFYSH